MNGRDLKEAGEHGRHREHAILSANRFTLWRDCSLAVVWRLHGHQRHPLNVIGMWLQGIFY
jgi:hypothetical protein